MTMVLFMDVHLPVTHKNSREVALLDSSCFPNLIHHAGFGYSLIRLVFKRGSRKWFERTVFSFCVIFNLSPGK